MEEMETLMVSMNLPKFKAAQLYKWIYNNQVPDIMSMTNLSKPLRDILSRNYELHALNLLKISGSKSSAARKFLFQMTDGSKVESVLMRSGKRVTICISSQVGCALDCKFCATGEMGFKKNLSAGEIVDQVIQLQSYSKERITNVVYMGMGEPFLNYKRVITSALLLNDKNGFGLGAGRITISTSGIVPAIQQFAEEKQPFKLAISLNASSQSQRISIMPIAKTHSLNSLMKTVRYYFKNTGRKPTFEYVLLDSINDEPADGKRLLSLIGKLPCKLNVIPYNEIDGLYKCPPESRLKIFLEALKPAPFMVTVRRSKGIKIDAGCGQLAVKHKN